MAAENECLPQCPVSGEEVVTATAVRRLEARIDNLKAELNTQRIVTESGIQDVGQNRIEIKELQNDVRKCEKEITDSIKMLEDRTVTREEITEIVDTSLNVSFNHQVVAALKRILMLATASIFTLVTAWIIDMFHLR